MPRRLRLAIVIPNQSRDDGALTSVEPRNICVQGQILAMFVMPSVAHRVPHVMEKCACLEKHARFGRQMVYRLERIKEQDRELTNVFGVALVVFESPCEAARTNQKLAGRGAIPMRFLSRESVACNFLDQAFPNTNAGNRKTPQVQITAERDESDGRYGHDIRTVAPHAIS